MKTESIFKLLLRLRLRPHSSKRCLSLENKLLTKRLPWSRLNSLPCQLSQPNQLNKKKMMDISRPSKKSRQRWPPLKPRWIRDFNKLIKGSSRCNRRLPICQTLAHLPTFTDPFQTWVK